MVKWTTVLSFSLLSLLLELSLTIPAQQVGPSTTICNLSADAGTDQSICSPGGFVGLNGNANGDYCYYYWSPTSGLTNPYTLNPTASVTTTTTYSLTAVGPNPNGQNLIFNGDFEQGDVGFTSDYYWDPSGILDEEAYFITTRGDYARYDWQPCMDHTSNSGNMMAVNASLQGNVKVWCQQVNVSPDTDYIFSLWLVTLFPANPAILQFSINGQVIGEPFSASPQTCLWQQNCTAWNSGNVTTAEICIINLNTVSWGNDFAIDDIHFAEACTHTDEVTIYVNEEPEIQNFNTFCNADNTSYQLSFEALGGAGNYQVNGLSGSWNGSVFISDPIPTGNSYNFQLSDINQCGNLQLNGSHTCVCITDAGNLAQDTLHACKGETVTAQHFNDQILDGNDVLEFILHDQAGSSLGTILARSNSPSFTYFSGLMAGQVYYISAVAGDNDGSGKVDLSSVCLSVSEGVPLVFHPLPTAGFTLPTEICEGSQAIITFQLSGNGPFNILWQEGGVQQLLSGVSNGYQLEVSPSSSTDYTLLSIQELSGQQCSDELNVTQNLTVSSQYLQNVQMHICEGEAAFLAGNWQSMAGLFVDSLQSQYGCDSIVTTELFVHSIDTTSLLIQSCDSTAVGVVEYHLQSRYGCDSLVIIDTRFVESHYVWVFEESCHPQDTGIEILNLTNQQGCDSLVEIHTSFLQSDTVYQYFQDCDTANIGIFESWYTNEAGCDSLVRELVDLAPSHEIWLYQYSCDPQLAGLEILNYTNTFGCDSTIFTETILLASDTTFLEFASCDPNEAGLTYQYLTNRHGCDSTVISHTQLLPSHQTEQHFTTCQSTEVGMDSSYLINQFGCDSLVITSTTLLSIHHCDLQVLATGDHIECNELDGALSLEVLVGLPPFDYSWQDLEHMSAGEGQILTIGQTYLIAGLGPGNYEIEVSSANGLTTTVYASITEAERMELDLFPTSDYNGYPLSCPDAADGSAMVMIGSGGNRPFDYFWSNGSTSAEIADLPQGWYYVTVVDALACLAIDSIWLGAPDPLTVELAVTDVRCFGFSDGSIAIEQLGGGVPPYQFAINDQPFQSESMFDNLSDGNYQIWVQDANGCQTSEWLAVNMPAQLVVSLGPDTLINLGDSLQIKALLNVPPALLQSLSWSNEDCDFCTTLPVAPLVTTAYNIQIIDEAGCTASDALTVAIKKDRDVFIPNVFSPNGDGINDQLTVFAGRDVALVKSFRIYSRWGELLYQALNFPPNTAEIGWNGRFKDQLLNPGVYVYMAEVEFIDGYVGQYVGDVSLIR